ncbi:MAG: hypothetical protein REI96_21845 [Flavobacterium nitrogenifigens]|uniref:hypothetical protein n=1 Tax=Flavobacterium nitrogenifigens TaxID=1617283 RepID=UPI002808D809|nr:hypothetical protein [Flavobacterium nitrogenifigens]MDQ8015104.1 hypothetical protein [Flavobacterium nitrogenifigens]MDQ8054296.1 hypothetical protein [Pedobacter sp.]
MDLFFQNFNIDQAIKILTTFLAFVLAIKAIIEYKKTQKWKKNEFLAKEIKDFFADREVKKTLLILDWNRIDLPLYDNEIPENNTRSIFYIDEIHLANSLSTEPESVFTDEETIIRKSIDEFLVKLSMFQNYIDNKLITTKDLKPYLEYWINMIGDRNKAQKNPMYIENLWKFIKRYEYSQVIKLLKSFDHNI